MPARTVLHRFKIISYAKTPGSHLVQESSPQPLRVEQDVQGHIQLCSKDDISEYLDPCSSYWPSSLWYFFLVVSNWNFPCCNFCMLPLILFLHTPKMNVHLLHTLPPASWRQVSSPLSLFFHKQNQTSSPSISSYTRCSSPNHPFTGLSFWRPPPLLYHSTP